MSLKDYEDSVQSYIHDDDKLVTYKWLSKEFEIHVNVAKDILKQYWEKFKDEEKIVATFLLIGQLNDRSIRVEVVKESNLSTAKSKFVKVDCEHLYSLQKALPDIELLAFAGEGDLRYSAIKCNDDYIRNDEEIEGLRYVGNIRKEESKSTNSNKIVNKDSEKQVSKQVDSSSKKKSESIINIKNDLKNKEKSEVKSEVKSEAKSEVKSEVKAAAPEKKISPKSNNNTKANNKLSKKPVQSKQSGFNNLFAKASNKPQVSDKPKEDLDADEKQKSSLLATKDETQVSKEDTKSFKVKDNKNRDQEKEKTKDNQEKEKAKDNQENENRNHQSKEESKDVSKVDKIDKSKHKNKKDSRGKKRNRSKEKNTSSKRKRIVVLDSSEDESNKSNNGEEEEEEPMEFEEETPKFVKRRSLSPPTEKRENGKRMVRKTIDKTFKDEDGYLVTKRVHVYEPASDDEPVEAKKEEPQKPKPVEVKVKKQTTLMNFFKKS